MKLRSFTSIIFFLICHYASGQSQQLPRNELCDYDQVYIDTSGTIYTDNHGIYYLVHYNHIALIVDDVLETTLRDSSVSKIWYNKYRFSPGYYCVEYMMSSMRYQDESYRRVVLRYSE